MRIGELADTIGVSADTIRFYEKSGVLPQPARQRDNGYREYSAADADHLRLLIDLRRLEIPLADAARMAGWCHAGHCESTSSELPRLLADRRAEIAERIDGLRALDARLAELQAHLHRQRRTLTVIDADAPCCDAAAAVVGVGDGTCACCATPLSN
jgi:DNA-binding transcriptional MerR regulator